ncbi:hypothetical protein AZE42_12821 [Rhizopogon vesiculosus]|uniref:Uncharacterized protein n=1 Tax=Rhizopogon vesiculosus TaxID=180088 RepID=A0A1J8R1C4_9AGAM|nr:hypothetical protein AZE42_12821 [Rhizopogon vesiculosus]
MSRIISPSCIITGMRPYEYLIASRRNGSPGPHIQLCALSGVSNRGFIEKAMHSDTPVEVPWSDWGPQHACYFPLDASYAFDIFGSKLTCALPVGRTPEPGEGPEGLLLSSGSHV